MTRCGVAGTSRAVCTATLPMARLTVAYIARSSGVHSATDTDPSRSNQLTPVCTSTNPAPIGAQVTQVGSAVMTDTGPVSPALANAERASAAAGAAVCRG
ncbi:hypothetical protein EB73_15560 [Mycobacterium sp. SWH-M3]|nr:hypothetical protein EB73_15560 [Mycobacterium sp. SWH-M3]